MSKSVDIKIVIFGAVIMGLAIIGLITSSNRADETKKPEEAVVPKSQSKDIQLIDVREADEYEESHADGAINVPLGEIVAGNYSKIDKSQPVYVYCRSGVRAAQAKATLDKAGYPKVINIGGISDWQNDGGRVCSSVKPDC